MSWLAACALAAGAAGCSSGGGYSGNQTLTVGVLNSSVGCAPYYLAQRDGLFASHGVTVKTVALTSDQQGATELSNGGIDVACGQYPAYFAADGVGELRLHVVAEGFLAQSGTAALMAEHSNDTYLADPAHLKGERIAIDPSDQVAELMLDTELASANLTLSDLTVVNMPESQMPGAISAGQVTAGVMLEPNVTDAEINDGLTVAMDLASGPNTNFPVAGYFSSDEVAVSKATALTHFSLALDTAQTRAAERTDIEPVLRSRINGLTPQAAAVMSTGSYPSSVDPDRLQHVVQLMLQNGGLPFSIVVKNMTSGSVNVID